MNEVPAYRDLPIRSDLPRRSSWGVFGEDDDVGAMNLLTSERLIAAAALVRRGVVFPLNWDLDSPSPPILGRKPLEHTVLDGPSGPDDRYDVFFPQASSQWDGLSHVRHPVHGYYNGWEQERVITRDDPRLGIDAWARRGLAGRFVLVDVARHFEDQGRAIDPSRETPVTVDDLDAVLAAQDVSMTPGTFLLLRFGWMAWYRQVDEATRLRLGRGGDFSTVDHDLEGFFPAPGISREERTAAWLWDHGVVAAISDSPAVESMPMSRDSEENFLHYRVVSLLGIGLGEMWDLDALAADCAEDGVYEGLLTSAPLNKSGGTGSPANALAIK